MTAKLVNLLEAAAEANEISDRWFSCFQKHEITDKKMSDMYWQMCKEENSRCDALLEAYAIMTGKIINKWDIESEIESLSH